jgi:hypothetical protein
VPTVIATDLLTPWDPGAKHLQFYMNLIFLKFKPFISFLHKIWKLVTWTNKGSIAQLRICCVFHYLFSYTKICHGDVTITSTVSIIYIIFLFSPTYILTNMCIKIWQDNYEVRKHILLHLLYTGTKNTANIPEGVRDYLQRYISLTDKKQRIVAYFSTVCVKLITSY